MTPVVKDSEQLPLHSIQIETTSRCNLNCKTCLKPVYEKIWRQRDMEPSLFKKIIRQIREYKPDIHLQGWGEPLTHKDFLSFVRQLKKEKINTSFTTNGTIMSENLARSIVASGVDGVTFSMAGGCSLTQDFLRGEGTFSLLQNAITTLVDVGNQYENEGPQIAISYLLTPDTITELPLAVSWCRSRGVDAFVTVALTQTGGGTQKALEFLPSKEEAAQYRFLRIRTNVRALFGRMKLDLKPFYPTLTPVCNKNPLNSLFISANGDVSPCVFLAPPVWGAITWQRNDLEVRQKRFVMGNLKDLTLKEIWETDQYEKFREKFKQRKKYHDEKLSKVSYSASGSYELEKAIVDIEKYFISHSPPKQCLACAKLYGY